MRNAPKEPRFAIADPPHARSAQLKKMPLHGRARAGAYKSPLLALLLLAIPAAAEPLSLAREGHWLIVRSSKIPGGEIRTNYLEAYCRANSSDADWVKHTVIPHKSETLAADARTIRLRDTLADGVIVEHQITASADAVDLQLVAHNPTAKASEVHWAQPCTRLSAFTGFDEKTASNATDYLSKCFIFLDGQLTRMPTPQWATEARYTPGQVWIPAGVPRTDANPRPHNMLVPSHGLIGCFSADERLIFATAWEPYQELFQGVARCLHADFRIGGLAPGETKKVRGKIYVVPADETALLERYTKDFPERAGQRARRKF